jgi:hypothetical protein
MWTISDQGQLVNMEAVRSVAAELSDDRQFVYVHVRWASSGERLPLVTLIVQEYGDTRVAMAIGQTVVDAIRDKLTEGGHFFELPAVGPKSE